MVSVNCAQFYDSYFPQNFSFPDSIMHYISQKPFPSENYEKMIQTCKTFFIKNSILVIRNLCFNSNDGWTCGQLKNINLKNILSKLWISESLNVEPKSFLNPKKVEEKLVTSLIVPKIFECRVENLILHEQNITFEELEILASFAKGIDLRDCILKYKNGNCVELEKIVESFPNADRIISPLNPKITSETVKNLLKIPHFAKLKYFIVKGVPEEFDIERFFIYIKTNQYTNIGLIFSKDSISEAYQNRLNEIVDEMINTKNHDYKVALINFPSCPSHKLNQIVEIRSKDRF